MLCYFYYDTVIGRVWAAENGCGVTHLCATHALPPPAAVLRETPLLHQLAEELREYLAGTRTGFTVPLAPQGTPFQMRVWAALCAIPYGKTRSYQQIAQALGQPAACRAVGGANHQNPILIIIPCHRVVGKNGTLTGYGAGLPLKARLLELEAAVCQKIVQGESQDETGQSN